ncbi:hypothetical protein CDL15_Pgr006144 [Punica granatum]|uniref:Uncharacterized protein n=1 Tax=Punica granatum TaxID=22663 RepID=A0A218VVF4_PUNGR|nr:hypothetical protein CDL15_Pgr006144 [Punica granatum]
MILVLLPPKGWSGFGSSTGETPSGDSQNGAVDSSNANSMVAKFLMEELSIPNVEKLMENAQRKLMGSNSCWQNDYRNLFAGCAEILAVAEKRSRFTWHLSDCFQRDSGRSPFPHCDERSSTADCRKKLDPTEGTVFLKAQAFKQKKERLVKELKSSAEYAEDKLDSIIERLDSVSRSSKESRDALASIDLRTQQLSQESKNVEEHVATVCNHTEAAYEQS